MRHILPSPSVAKKKSQKSPAEVHHKKEVPPPPPYTTVRLVAQPCKPQKQKISTLFFLRLQKVSQPITSRVGAPHLILPKTVPRFPKMFFSVAVSHSGHVTKWCTCPCPPHNAFLVTNKSFFPVTGSPSVRRSLVLPKPLSVTENIFFRLVSQPVTSRSGAPDLALPTKLSLSPKTFFSVAVSESSHVTKRCT